MKCWNYLWDHNHKFLINLWQANLAKMMLQILGLLHSTQGTKTDRFFQSYPCFSRLEWLARSSKLSQCDWVLLIGSPTISSFQVARDNLTWNWSSKSIEGTIHSWIFILELFILWTSFWSVHHGLHFHEVSIVPNINWLQANEWNKKTKLLTIQLPIPLIHIYLNLLISLLKQSSVQG